MGSRFANRGQEDGPHRASEVLRWALFDPLLGRRRRAPAGQPAPAVVPDLELVHDRSTPSLVWIGHASFLGRLGGTCFCVDPVFSKRAGPSYRRHCPPGLEVGELPSVDLVLVTHNHYDHLDLGFLRGLPRGTQLVAPAGLGRWLERRGLAVAAELEWWESDRVAGLEITLVPARHWSRRGLFDTNRTLWGGYVVEGGGLGVVHAGDSGYGGHFAEIGRRFPGLAAAMLPIGGYRPGWFMERHHMTPEQAGQAFIDLGAARLVPMHWGVFRLTDERLSEPIDRLERWWATEPRVGGCRLCRLAVGEGLSLAEPRLQAHGGAP